MAKKLKQLRTKPSQTVRVEVIAPTSNDALVPVVGRAIQAEETVEAALAFAKSAAYYHDELLKLISATVPKSEIYAYAVGASCKKCGSAVKYDGYCRPCGKRMPSVENFEPYFSADACRLALKRIGVKLEDPEMRHEQYQGKEGPYIIVQYWVTATPRRGEAIRTMGSRSTSDDFFARRYRVENGKRVPYKLSLEEVNMRFVELGAMSHALNRVLRDLGFMPTAQHMTDAGVKLAELRRITFGRDREEFQEFAAAASQAAPQGGDSAPSAPAGSLLKGSERPAGAIKQPASSAPGGRNQADMGEIARNPERWPLAPPKAKVPAKIEAVRWTKPGGSGLIVSWAGRQLYCFDNKKVDEDGGKLFDLLVNSQGKDALFITEKKGTTDGRVFEHIVGVIQVGDREWEDGVPVLRRSRMREAGEEGD